jgi:ferredoxin
VEAAPGTFALGSDGIAVKREGGPDDGVLEAVRGCPMGAISVVDDETGEQIA